jgi:hypothetical protein
MKKVKLCLWVIGTILLFACMVSAKKPVMGIISPGEYQSVSITNHTPESRRGKEYWDSRQKVDLVIGGQEKFKDLPKLGMKQPFTGYIRLGDKPQQFGVIVDIVGNEKRLYIDTDGDGSFAKESWYPLLNEWYGLEIYTVESPEPITLNVPYSAKKNQNYLVEIEVGGLLNKPGPFFKTKPFLDISVRTWFLVRLLEDGTEKLAAIVDRNNNGRFNDPQDAFYFDSNDDGYFSDNEMMIREKKVTIKSGKEKLSVDWDVYPDKMWIGGKAN